MSRPAVSVVVPFRGTLGEAQRLLRALSSLDLRDGDEILVADNSPDPIVPDGRGVTVVRADRLASSYYARNVGAEHAGREWIVFLDYDVTPPAALLDLYFATPLADTTGIVAGEVSGAPSQTALTARHARSRNHLGVAVNLIHRGPYPCAGTANLMVRRTAWGEVGGFQEVRSGADLEFCWRVQQSGWAFELRPDAKVEHLHAEGLRPTLSKAARYGAGQSWSNSRFPGSAPRPPLLRQLLRSAAGLVVWSLLLRFERAGFKALDGAWAAAYAFGYYRGDNGAPPLRA